MKEISTVLIAGAGAIGSMVAWQIFRHDAAAVSILAGGERLERYRKDGFVINGERFDFPLAEVDGRSEADLVIVACKAHHLDAVIADLSGHVGSNTLILSLLNGISSEETIARVYGGWRIPYAMIVGTDAGHRGNHTDFTKTGTIFLGDGEAGRRSERVDAIASFFAKAGIAHTVPFDMKNRLWFKFMMNVGLNQVTAILRRPYGVFKTATKVPEAAELLEGAMREVIAIAAAEGIALGDADIAEIYRTLDTLADGGKTSMHQDVEAGRKTEVGLFSGTMLELGRKHGIPVPVNATLWRMLRAIEKSYQY